MLSNQDEIISHVRNVAVALERMFAQDSFTSYVDSRRVYFWQILCYCLLDICTDMSHTSVGTRVVGLDGVRPL